MLSAQKLPLLQGLGEVNVGSLTPQFIEETDSQTQTCNLSSLVGRHLPSHQGWNHKQDINSNTALTKQALKCNHISKFNQNCVW